MDWSWKFSRDYMNWRGPNVDNQKVLIWIPLEFTKFIESQVTSIMYYTLIFIRKNIQIALSCFLIIHYLKYVSGALFFYCWLQLLWFSNYFKSFLVVILQEIGCVRCYNTLMWLLLLVAAKRETRTILSRQTTSQLIRTHNLHISRKRDKHRL